MANWPEPGQCWIGQYLRASLRIGVHLRFCLLAAGNQRTGRRSNATCRWSVTVCGAWTRMLATRDPSGTL